MNYVSFYKYPMINGLNEAFFIGIVHRYNAYKHY